MRIPSAVDAGFGQQIMKSGTVPMPGAPVMPDNSGAQIGEALQGLGKTGTLIAADQIRYDREVEEVKIREAAAEAQRRQREADLEAKHLAQAEQQSAAELKWLGYQEYLTGAAQTIAHNTDLKDDQAKQSAFTETADTARSEFFKEVPDPLIRARMAPHILQQTMVARSHLDEQLARATADRTRANENASLTTVINSARSYDEKLALIDSLPLTSYNQTQQEELRRSSRDQISRLDLDQRIEATRDQIPVLQQLKAALTAKDERGENYTLYPHLDAKSRDAEVLVIDSRIQTAQAQAEHARREAEARARETANELMYDYERRVNDGWWPKNTTADNAYMRSVARAAGMSPVLSRRYQEYTAKMTDFTFREQRRTKDPLGTKAAEQGYSLSPLDLTNPASVARRLDDARKLGVKTPLRGPEIDALTDHLNTMTPQQMTTYVKSFTTALGPYGAPLFDYAADQVRMKDPTMATVFKLVANGKPDAARLYAEGKEFLKGEGKDFLKEKLTTVRSDLDTRIKTALGTALAISPASQNAVRDAVAVAYLGTVRQRNQPLDKVDPDLLATVTRQVIGDTTITGNQYRAGSWKTTIVPPDMTPDQFLNRIKAITPEAVAQRGGINGMSDADAAKFLKTHAWHEYGGGYRFYNADRTDVYRKDGKVFEWRW